MNTLSLPSVLACCFINSIILAATVRPLFRFSKSDYPSILRTTSFVDKSLMIEDVISEPEVFLVTAPPRFGKSTNLDMLKRFFEIQVYEDGSLVTKANLTCEPVNDTSNYDLFVRNKLKITKMNITMDKYFGKTPVIMVNFHCQQYIKSFDQAIEFFKKVIHSTYVQHKYLMHSEKLTNHQKAFFERWCNETSYLSLNKHHIAHGLRVLSTYLYRHFDNRRVFVIIDEHDSIITKSMFDVPSAAVLQKIVALSVSMIGTAVTKNDVFVKGGLISGISDIPQFGFSDLNNIKTYRFLHDHNFLNYYGLTKNEALALFNRTEFKLNSSIIEEAHQAYNGYQTEKGFKIYNTYSVLRFLKTGMVTNYWTKFTILKRLRNVFKIKAFKQYIDDLVEGKTISVVILEKMSIDDLIDLRGLLLNPHNEINYWPATLFHYLLRQGYLTPMAPQRVADGVSIKHTTIKIPNTEIRQYMANLN